MLQAIGRRHTAAEIRRGHRHWPGGGLRLHVNMDLIAGLPADSAGGLPSALWPACWAWHPDNITVHTLALKKGARSDRRTRGRSLRPEEVAADAGLLAEAPLAGGGLRALLPLPAEIHVRQL